MGEIEFKGDGRKYEYWEKTEKGKTQDMTE